MRKLLVGSTLLMGLLMLGSALAQSINASLSGTVQDTTQAVISGAMVTATNTETGVVLTTKANESGVYTFASLQPGKSYTVSAELTGFRTKVFKDLELGSSQQVRQNFVLQLGESASTTVDVSIAADSLLATSGASIGNVLSASKVRDLPLIGNNVLDLINIMNGYTPPAVLNNSASAASATLAGLPIMSVNTTMDGISVQDNRYNLGVTSATHINPDLVEEIRLIVAPVDAETGRGSGQVKILTKSGTNKFTGSAFWNVQNSALNANTWSNNRTGVKPNWSNQQQYSVSYGGPIVKNKTFFFALYEGQTMNSRSLQTATVLTAEARKGNFRFFPGITNGNTDATTLCTGTTPTAPVVDVLGNPVLQSTLQAACPLLTIGAMQTVSVFGRDTNRPGFDPTGFVQRVIADMPLPNYFGTGSGDGLNQAQFRWTRKGDSVIGGQQGLESDVNRKQLNVKVDENLNPSNKLTLSFSDERRHSTTSPSVYPGGWTPSTTRTPRVITVSYTSTLSSTMVNEFRFGFQRTKGGTYYPYDDPATKDAVLAFLPNVNGIPIIGAPLTYNSNRLNPGLNTNVNNGPLYSYADTLSWAKGKHAYKGGVEFRAVRAEGFNSLNGIPHVAGGAGNIGVQGITAALIPGLIGTSATGTNTGTGTLGGAQSLLLSLNGSVATVAQAFILQDGKQTSRYLSYADPNGYYKEREYDHNEQSVFFKDDWKIRPSLTLNLGVRWEHYGVPWEKNGLMASVVHGGTAGGFGYTGTSFADWGKFGPQKGDLTTVEFVGVNSPHPNEQLYKDDWNNFGPNVGFSWSLPWFGKDKTTLRGGYGISFQSGVSPFDLDTNVSMMPGINDAQTVTPSGFTNLANLVIPSAVVNVPLQPVPLNQRNQSIAPYDSNYVTPYIQNFNVSVTRTVRRNLTVDIRWVGTRGVKLFGSVNLNQVNYFDNGLLDALKTTRAGGSAPLFDTILQGLTLNSCAPTPCTNNPTLGQGVVNGTTLTGSAALRANATYKSNIANGNFAAVASSLNTSTVIASLGAGGLLQNGGLAANFVTNNPQFLNVNLQTNPNNSIYHSLQNQVSYRPIQGVSLQATYSFQRGIASNNAGGTTTWLNVLNRDLDRSLQGTSHKHDFRLNGTFELPLGPNKLLLGNSNGILARLVERWEVSTILNLISGSPLDITGTNTYIGGGGQPEVVGSLAAVKDGHARMTSGLPNWFAEGQFTFPDDPQCAAVTNLQTTQSSCSNNALADAAGNLLVVNSQPGKLGNLGPGVFYGPGTIGFDASASKTVRITENKSAQIRMDAKNVLNHPLMGNPNLNINGTTFGQITTVTGSRTFQGTLRFTF